MRYFSDEHYDARAEAQLDAMDERLEAERQADAEWKARDPIAWAKAEAYRTTREREQLQKLDAYRASRSAPPTRP